MIGANLKRIRIANKVSIEKIAKELRRKDSVINSWELGISIPDEDSIIKLARILNVSVDDLLIPENSKIVYIDCLKKEHKKIVRDLELAFSGQLGTTGTECCALDTNRIKYLRKIYRNTQSQLATHLDTSRSSVNSWEMELSKPSVSDIVLMSLKYKTPPSFFLFRNSREALLLTDISSERMDLIISVVENLKEDSL